LTKPTPSRLDTLEKRVGAMASIIDRMKGERIVVLDLRGLCNFADAFIIATARSRTHMQSIVKRLAEELREQGLRPLGKPRVSDVRWALIDYADVIVHVFDAEARMYYDLETLWGDAEPMNWERMATA
jgi:ribosome-associated protein